MGSLGYKIPVPPASELRLMRNQGKNRLQIAAHYGVSLATVKRWIADLDLRSRSIRPRRTFAFYQDLVVQKQLRIIEIAPLAGMCPTAVSHDLTYFGLRDDVCKFARKTRDRREATVSMYRAGASYREIGDKFGICTMSAANLCKRIGLTSRKKGAI